MVIHLGPPRCAAIGQMPRNFRTGRIEAARNTSILSDLSRGLAALKRIRRPVSHFFADMWQLSKKDLPAAAAGKALDQGKLIYCGFLPWDMIGT
jgi:hypothetical protein